MMIEFILFAVTGLVFYYWINKRPKDFPPGPLGLPLVGSIPFMGRFIHKTLKEVAKKYGSIFSVDLGNWRIVVLDDPKIIREAFKENVFSGRPLFDITIHRGFGESKGILFADGEEWNENRRFALRNLKDFGFGRNSMESIIQQELTELIELVGKQKGAVSTEGIFNASVLNVLWAIVAGDRFKLDDPELIEIVSIIDKIIKDPGEIHMFMPWISRISPRLSGLKRSIEGNVATVKFIRKHLDAHKKTHVMNSPRDFIDVYLDNIKETTNEKSVFYKESGYKSAIYSVLDLFLAGSETTSTTLRWTFLYMAVFPEKQKKLQEEIDQVIGNSRLPQLTDRRLMPYTEATIYEIMRYSSLVPLNLFHRAMETIKFHGFTIPKDTMVISNLYSVHHSEEIWGDPAEFRPERFLSKDEKTVVKNDAFLAFSVGKRSCIGELLARDELFLFLTGLFQRFSVSLDSSNPHPNYTDSFMGSVLVPKDHLLNIKDRLK